MTSIVFTGTGTVHFLVVLLHKSLSTGRITPNPILESIPDCLLFLRRQSGFLGIENTALLAIGILNRVINANIPKVQ